MADRVGADGHLGRLVRRHELDYARGLELNVRGIAPAKDGGLWVAGGVAHLSLRHAALLWIRDDQVEAWMDNWIGPLFGNADRKVRFQIADEASVEAFGITAEGRPLLVTAEHGLFEVEVLELTR